MGKKQEIRIINIVQCFYSLNIIVMGSLYIGDTQVLGWWGSCLYEYVEDFNLNMGYKWTTVNILSDHIHQYDTFIIATVTSVTRADSWAKEYATQIKVGAQATWSSWTSDISYEKNSNRMINSWLVPSWYRPVITRDNYTWEWVVHIYIYKIKYT